MAIAEVSAFSEPVGNRANDQERKLALAASVLPAQGLDEFDVEVVDVSGGKGLHGGPRCGFIATPLFGSGPKLAVAAVAAASVVAKVTRDRSMDRYHRRFPVYGFDTNRGYGTRKHWDALERHGPSPIHRISFKGVHDIALRVAEEAQRLVSEGRKPVTVEGGPPEP